MARRLIHTDAITGFKVYRDTDWNEYQVIHPTNANASYHTDDKQDALNTMAAMIEQHKKLPEFIWDAHHNA